jgi:small neutral amino acid transporter SnatA (MarC family)
MAIAFAIIFGLFAFGFLLLFLTKIFGTALFSLIAVGAISLVWIGFMCYKVASEQYGEEQRRSEKVMERLRT